MGSDERRAARRAFIRAHHPDAGGDPGRFIAGLRRWDDAEPDAGSHPVDVPRVWVIAHHAWPRRFALGLVGRVARRGRRPRVR